MNERAIAILGDWKNVEEESQGRTNAGEDGGMCDIVFETTIYNGCRAQHAFRRTRCLLR
jgi:hypothetical protein